MSWQDRALCAQCDPDSFFPELGQPNQIHHAKMICRRCPVRAQCLDDALENNERFGIWGGMTVPERERLQKEIAA